MSVNTENEKTNKVKLTKKQKLAMIVLTPVTLTIMGVGLYHTVTNIDDSLSDEVQETNFADGANVDGLESSLEPAKPYVDERVELDETTVETTLAQVRDLMKEGQWGEIVQVVENIDLEYNLDSSDDGKELKMLLRDATTLARITSMGDTTEALEQSIKSLPNLETEEMFVLGLYYLPRNVLLELSNDHLALAPSQKGYVDITNRTDLFYEDENGEAQDVSLIDDVIARYVNYERMDEFEEGFVRFDIENNGILEYVYVIHQSDGTFGLMGFYSDDTNLANTTQTVDHHLKIREDVSKGVESLLQESQERYEDDLNEIIDSEQ